MCPHCRSLSWTAVESAGRGTVHSFVLPRHPPWPWFDGTYIVALVELEEGTRIVSNLCDVDPNDVTIGMPVQAFIEHYDNGVSLTFSPSLPSVWESLMFRLQRHGSKLVVALDATGCTVHVLDGPSVPIETSDGLVRVAAGASVRIARGEPA